MNKKEKLDRCAVCQKAALHRCSGCSKIAYCNKEHQKIHWKEHKKICRPFKVCENDTLGRYLIATRLLEPGDVIIQEKTLISGPSLETGPVCVSCNKAANDSISSCSKCGWPVCNDLCEKSPNHLPECKYTAQRGNKIQLKNFNCIQSIYKCVLVLRCLYQKQFLPKIWKQIEELESNLKERMLRADYEGDRIAVAEFIRRFFKLKKIFSEEDIMKVWGIITTNSHEVPLADPPYIAIYPKTSLLEHNCLANCSKSFTNDGKILITAAKTIKEGDHLSISYTDSLWGTPNRRQFLYETKYFWCNCARCEDPTEFGTYFSGIKCQNLNCKGYLIPQTFTNDTKLFDWHCQKCDYTMTSYSAFDILERLGSELFDLDKTNISECKKFLESYKTYLPENHFYNIDVKYNLSQMLGTNGVADLSNDDLITKLKYCKQLESLVKILAPAEKRVLGTILFEHHAALAVLARRNKEVTSVNLQESRKVLLEAIELLKYEPDVLPEGKIYIQAQQNLKDIDLILNQKKT